MPSRKKAKGKARKAQAAAGVPQQRSLCTHGFAAPDKNDALWACYDAFERELSRLEEDPRYKSKPAVEGMQAIMVVAEHKCPHLWNASVKEKLTAKLLADGVDCLLDSVVHSTRDQVTKVCGVQDRKSIALMSAVLVLENWDGRTSVIHALPVEGPLLQEIIAKHRNAFEGDRRSKVRFFTKRTQCSCLDGHYAKLKQFGPKVGACSHCKEVTEWRRLMVCGACKRAHYCSATCQKLHWSDHKEGCRYVIDLLGKNES